MRCRDCQFYWRPDEQCRRREPKADNEHLRKVVAALAYIALGVAEWAQEARDELGEMDSDFDGERWPYIDVNDWCGEFQQRSRSLTDDEISLFQSDDEREKNKDMK